MTSPHPAKSGLPDAIRAGAAGLYSLEAACELIIGTGWLHRGDFACFVSTGTSLTDGVTELAHIDWQAAITSRDTGHLPCSSGENRTLRLAASIAAGIPVDLNDALTGLDQARIALVIQAVRHANGQRPADFAGSCRYDVHHTGDRKSPHGPSPPARNFRTRTARQNRYTNPLHTASADRRHTFGTRLVNRDVPLEVIRILLDHESTEMTAYYARISDDTVRRHWENGTRVNINGERVTIGPDGPLAQAQWAKTRYGMATQTLPNGWCGLPIQKRCPHANACLTCPVFLTGPEFLPELRQQRHRTLTLIDISQNNGQTRLAEMNTQVLANLDRMIGEIDKDASTGTADAS